MGKPTAAEREKRRQAKLLRQKQKKQAKRSKIATQESPVFRAQEPWPLVSYSGSGALQHDHGDFDCPICSAPYDPNSAPDPDEWSMIDESMKHELVLNWHRHGNIDEPNMPAHIGIHIAVENQVIDESTPQVRDAIHRLMQEGLDRHEAVHAVGAVLAETMLEIMETKEAGPHVNQRYLDEVAQLTAASWRSRANDEQPHEDAGESD